MRKKVTFEKHIAFPTMIGEISAISFLSSTSALSLSTITLTLFNIFPVL